MKKILIILLVILLTGCIRNKKELINNIELKNVNCKIITEIESHDGFLNDGDYFAKMSCKKINKSSLSSNWKKLPLSEEISKVIDMDFCDRKDCKNFYENYNVPTIKNGYYIFIDRHSLSNNKYDDSEINDRESYNFTIGIIDSDKNKIYYYELDT